ncbi:M23 family metallopeptidase [Jiangella alkaliphila]|uniref:M23 family metallopeptidase n=1 Tax=Jiangella alkaliphila TaxID=419479 RepID=UPI0018D37145|nr:M23 family metallopeptidase [Jiangella alkaliphila]
MRKIVIAMLVAVLAFGPAVALLGSAALNPAATTACLPGGEELTVGAIPDTLSATTSDGHPVTLDRTQLTHAATIITIGARVDGVGRDGVVIALIAALTESRLRMLANTGAYPESGDYPNDGDGSDNDSLGLFQMRPTAGWGSVADLMNAEYQSAAFYGGPTGPNHPSPPGLLDIPGWQDMDPGEAAQAVEVSAYPDRYRAFQPVAETILTTLTIGSGEQPVPEAGRVVFPLPAETWIKTSDFGLRIHPITGEVSFHSGTDYAATEATPILAAADGRVASTDTTPIYGGLIVIEHTIDDQPVATAYAHIWPEDIHVSPGQLVTAGQHIGDVGSAGQSTGPHLHLEVRPGGPDQPPVDPVPWLAGHHPDSLDTPDQTPGRPCTPRADPTPAPTLVDPVGRARAARRAVAGRA